MSAESQMSVVHGHLTALGARTLAWPQGAESCRTRSAKPVFGKQGTSCRGSTSRQTMDGGVPLLQQHERNIRFQLAAVDAVPQRSGLRRTSPDEWQSMTDCQCLASVEPFTTCGAATGLIFTASLMSLTWAASSSPSSRYWRKRQRRVDAFIRGLPSHGQFRWTRKRSSTLRWSSCGYEEKTDSPSQPVQLLSLQSEGTWSKIHT